MALAEALLLLLAASLATSDVTYRTCDCFSRDNRVNVDRRLCAVDEENKALSTCTDESVPRLPRTYVYVAPQGLFAVYRFHRRYHHARIYCAQEGGRLAVPESMNVYKKLQKLIKDEIDKLAYIGVQDMETEGTWLDIDGNKPPLLPWRKGEPNNYDDEDCGVIHPDGGLLDDRACWMSRPFVCERRLQKPIPSGYTWSRQAQKFYKILSQEKTFLEARRVCEQDGGALLSIDTNIEALYVLRLFPATRFDPWVDLNDDAAEGLFVDSRGHPLESKEFHFWRLGEPDNGAGHGPHNCVILVGFGYYVDVSCEDTHPVVCELTPY
ncbi:macrophage mannose receptor 1-like [Schistocerca americana]|uniref:macrophage mannose receptor 1-like n=1 Tax=Schistocerca americana TaxID=7009 RepID=UPI001F5011C1|nr:macrophage mannose receptor 1-like [Schistocerca americana]